MAALYWRIVGRPDYAMDCLRIAMEYADDDNKVCVCVCVRACACMAPACVHASACFVLLTITCNFFYTHTPLELHCMCINNCSSYCLCNLMVYLCT